VHWGSGIYREPDDEFAVDAAAYSLAAPPSVMAAWVPSGNMVA